jgi:hypothetical protein
LLARSHELKTAAIKLFKQIDDGQRDKKKRHDGTCQADCKRVAEKEGIHIVT